jgi:hypothetical protein
MLEGMGPKPPLERTGGVQLQAQEFVWQATLYHQDEAESGGASGGEYGVFKFDDAGGSTTLGQKEVARVARQEAVERMNAEKDEQGRSVNAVKGAERLHAEKDEQGRSVNGVKAAKRLNAEKDEQGRSVQGVKAAERLHAGMRFQKDFGAWVDLSGGQGNK